LRTSFVNAERRAPYSFNFGRAAVAVALGALALGFVAPVVYMAVESLRSGNGTTWTMSNWAGLLRTFPILNAMKNSLILAASSSILTVVVTACAGFAFAKLPFRGSRVVLSIVIVSLAFPMIAAIVPEYLDWASQGLVGSYLPPIVVYSAFNSAFAVIFFTNYFLSVPDAFIESAVTDGAGYFKVLWRIIVPMALPAIVTIAVFDFMLVWNDLLIALLFLPEGGRQTASVLLATVSAGKILRTPELLAGALLTVVPNVLLFLGFQRYLLLGFSLGVDK
jgi:ABC-type glycerol-3-phosphate transport system permease component